ncbi:molybdenum cofactor guanylyltransferase, partial [Bilophila wadsworthia]
MYGIVMAGGLSSRMGRNKLRLSIHGDGKDMLERTVELLGGFTDDVFVSCRAPEDAAPFKAIPDEVDRQGPFGGVYSALRRLQKPILVLSCDLPFMDGPTLRRLLDAREARLPGTIMTTYQQEETGFIEALVAVYEPACLPWFDAAWEQGIRKFSVVIPEELRTHVPYSRSEALPFFNINYPADFE